MHVGHGLCCLPGRMCPLSFPQGMYVYVWVHTQIPVMCVHAYPCMSVHVCQRVHVSVHVCEPIYVCVHMSTCVCAYPCTNTDGRDLDSGTEEVQGWPEARLPDYKHWAIAWCFQWILSLSTSCSSASGSLCKPCVNSCVWPSARNSVAALRMEALRRPWIPVTAQKCLWGRWLWSALPVSHSLAERRPWPGQTVQSSFPLMHTQEAILIAQGAGACQPLRDASAVLNSWVWFWPRPHYRGHLDNSMEDGRFSPTLFK